MLTTNYKRTFSNNSQYGSNEIIFSPMNTPFPYCYGSFLQFIKIFFSNFTLATFHFLFFEVNVCSYVLQTQMIDRLFES